jgi:hypothetical protein
MNTEDFANTQRAEAAARLQGSRFITGQLCNLAASGSRERPLIVQVYRQSAHRSPSEQGGWGKYYAGLVPGAACPAPKAFGSCYPVELPNHEAAPLQGFGGR